MLLGVPLQRGLLLPLPLPLLLLRRRRRNASKIGYRPFDGVVLGIKFYVSLMMSQMMGGMMNRFGALIGLI